MATFSRVDPKRMYSWWWDSHISPKNSKWLQENLTDMDANVKTMIKLIEEDADSFARRAEMYYKKRPELMKLVEEFYRAYRALAERYDNATGVLRHAHKTMTEAFPNQVPLMLSDDSPANSASEADPHTPEMSRPTRALFDPDDLQKESLGLSSSHIHDVQRNGAFTEESDSITSRKGLKQLNDILGSGGHVKFVESKVRKGLNFPEVEEKEQTNKSNGNHNLEAQVPNEILNFKEALAKLEAEKEAGLVQYQQSLERLSKLESEVSCAKADSRGLNERASKAEAEVQTLKEALTKLEAEKEASLHQYQQCLDRISNLDNILSHAQEDAGDLNERANKAETEAQSLKQDLAKVDSDKVAALDQYKQSLEMISNLENKLQQAEEDSRQFSERAEKAEKEVETLKLAIAKLTEEKEIAALEYQQCLETISSLEHKISSAHEEAQRLNGEIHNGVAKLKDAEERRLLLERSNQSLHSELESVVLKMGTQNQELTEKQQELGRLWTCIQEERMRFMEAETAFQTLQHLHSQAQEELRSLASELQNGAQILRDMEIRNHSLQDEVLKVKEENKSLNELNLSSAISIKDMQNDISSLREINGKLEEEVELRVDQRNALQQEIYCLKEELNELNKKHQAILDQVDAVGLDPEYLELSVKELQDENSNLNETCQRERSVKVALLEKLEILEQLLEKNALLENSLSDMSVELEGVRGKIEALEASCQSLLEDKSTLLDEKATLIIKLQVTTENLEKLAEKNTVLENSLSDAHDELEGLKAKSKSLEDSCHLLVNHKADLASQKTTLISQLGDMQQRLEDMKKTYTELEANYLAVEKEKSSTLCKVEELQVSLDVEKQEHANFVQITEARLAGMDSQILRLKEEGLYRKREYEEELDRALDSQIEIFVLRRSIQDLENNNFSVLLEYQKLLEASQLSDKLVSDLEQQNVAQQMEVKSLFDQTNTLRMGMYPLLKALDIALEEGNEDKIGQDQIYLNHALHKLEDRQISLCKTKEENQQMAIEVSVLVTLLGQLRVEAENLKMEKDVIGQELRIRTGQFYVMQSEALELLEMNEELRTKVMKGDKKEEVLMAQIENLHGKLLNTQEDYQTSQRENFEVLEEKRSLIKELLHLEEKNGILEEENCVILNEMLSLGNLSLIFKNYIDEKSLELKELDEDLNKLHGVNGALIEKLGLMLSKLEEVQMERLNLKETLQKSEEELKSVTVARDQLSFETENRNDLLLQKEMQFLEAEQKLSVTENENKELQNILKHMKNIYDEVMMIREDQENQIMKLSEDKDHLRKENGCLCDSRQTLEIELRQLREECETTKTQLETELQEGKNEIDIWETQAAAFFSELHISTICQTLFEEKLHELTEAFELLENESTSKDMVIELLKERVGMLEGENEGLKAQLAAYGGALISLRGCISSLENHACLPAKLQKPDNMEAKDAELVNHLHESHLIKDQNVTVPDALPELQDLQTTVRAIEKAVIEKEQLAMQEMLNAHTKLEAMMRQIEELKSVKSTSEISTSENGLLTKDIMLDQISESSSYGISRREYVEAVKKQKGGYPISDVLAEKELGVDKLEISKRFMEPKQEENKRKVLERLNSDVQKLTNLQITVQDLKTKLEITGKNRRGKDTIERDSLKGQLEESEDAILKLFDLNGKLMKNIEDDSAMESEESGSIGRRVVSEQAQRVSERIGRLQLEIQKIQYVLLKFDDEKESKGRRVLLRDYLYGGLRRNHWRKKSPCCGCVQPRTEGD